ncbi:MAG: putative baseplate assembly protein, partial [Candidatus Bathyarchaeota archaeon]|nr:putative baseplate assembly protein [Candidatus Termiticorpusculum sp.]
MTQNKPTFDAVKKQKKRTPTDLSNQPNLSALKYRVGTHNQFKADMIEQISHKPALKNLTTRDNADLSIALLDSWAMIADVLTFYQERIANEGYLRTATERRSVLELARTIGYELKPGVAASVSLAFIVENAPGSPLHSRVDEG